MPSDYARMDVRHDAEYTHLSREEESRFVRFLSGSLGRDETEQLVALFASDGEARSLLSNVSAAIRQLASKDLKDIVELSFTDWVAREWLQVVRERMRELHLPSVPIGGSISRELRIVLSAASDQICARRRLTTTAVYRRSAPTASTPTSTSTKPAMYLEVPGGEIAFRTAGTDTLEEWIASPCSSVIADEVRIQPQHPLIEAPTDDFYAWTDGDSVAGPITVSRKSVVGEPLKYEVRVPAAIAIQHEGARLVLRVAVMEGTWQTLGSAEISQEFRITVPELIDTGLTLCVLRLEIESAIPQSIDFT